MSGEGQGGKEGEPLELIRFKKEGNADNSEIQLVEETMAHIVEKVGSRPISIICVCGPTRGGKSFLLGYMIRCLEALENDVTDWMDWENSSKPLKGFKFRTGVDPETQGIWVWSRPYFVKDGDGNKVAVLLVDTQGTYDAFTSSKDMAAIVGLSLLTSSVMIFNFFKDLQEDVLTALNTYIQYGKHAQESAGSTGAPFQKLTFLIRDWNNPDDYRYGARGGKDFLEEKLKVKDGQPSESRNVRELIRSCFQKLDCFLMPSIGEKALKTGFTGSIDELSRPFANNLQEFINSQFLQDNVIVKEVMGASITASELQNLLKTYLDTFNSDIIPTAESMLLATAHISNMNAAEKAKGKYRDGMRKKQQGKSHLSIDELDEAHNTARREAIEFFQKSKRFGNVDIQEKYEKQVLDDARQTYDEIKAQNEAKRQQQIKRATDEAIDEFKSQFGSQYPFDERDNFYDDDKIQNSADKQRAFVLDDFKDKLSNESRSTLIELGKPVEEEIKNIVEELLQKNKARRDDAARKMGGIVEELWRKFRSELVAHLEENKMEEDENKLRLWASDLKSRTLEEYQGMGKPGKEDFQKDFLESLKTGMETVLTELLSKHLLGIQQLMWEAEKKLTEYCDDYEAAMGRQNNEMIENEDQLLELHGRVSEGVLEKFAQQGNPFPGGSERAVRLESQLKLELERSFHVIRVKFQTDMKPSVAVSERAVATAVSYYKVKIKAVMGPDEFTDEEHLTTEHERIFEQTLKQYERFARVGLRANQQVPSNQPLREKIEELYEHTKKTNTVARTVGENNASRCLNECVEEYNRIFKEAIGPKPNGAEVGGAHEKGKEAAVAKFKENFPLKRPINIKRYEEILGKKIEDCRLEVMEAFTPGGNETGAKVDPLAEYIKQYQDEMNAIFDIGIPASNFELEKHHNRVKGNVKASLEKKERPSLAVQHRMEKEYSALFDFYLDRVKRSKLQGDVPAIGIDLGTTYCCVGVYKDGKVIIIPSHADGGDLTTPSYVAFQQDPGMPQLLHETVGKYAKENAYQNPENTIFDAKRIIGRKMDDPVLQNDIRMWPFEVKDHEDNRGVPKVMVHGQFLSPEEISARLLKKLKQMVEEHLQLPADSIKKAVITVPAYFNDGQRQATIDAGEIAGLEVLKILNEPTAAALAYATERLDTNPRKVLIYDLGGGTFDVAVLDMKPNKEIVVLGVNGDTHLGGEDFDKSLMEYCALAFKPISGIDLFQGKDSENNEERLEARRRLRRLQTYCERVKKELATAKVAKVLVDAMADGVDLSVTVTRRKFEELNQVHFQRTIDLVDQTLKEVGLSKKDIDDIVLVGGSSKIVKVQEMLEDYFGGKTLNKAINPDLAVGHGAAVEAAMMNGVKPSLASKVSFKGIQDVTPLSLGIAVASGEFDIILKKNSKSPTRSTGKMYKTTRDNQTALKIIIYQGEDKKVAVNNQWLGEFILSGIPAKPKGKEEIEVVMDITRNGILRVKAHSKGNKHVNNAIVVRENKMRMSIDAKESARKRILRF